MTSLPARPEPKEWTREVSRGVGNVIIPSVTNDLRSLNEPAIRHDVRRNMARVANGLVGAGIIDRAPDPADFFVGRNPE